ncbi:hypothetical protein AC579_8080 [Pseudocercospora musae]|uniref:TIGR04076 family protein n=1 Tax=Pseudocercospora musae TaxID=113226 RepID=A0A139IG97_9PEZI|nr:hypothetical protein AC579_8080 [Pseudocercospora musae]
MADKFELYDLKVEVVCPAPGEKIYCGAKEGDHFILRGEMLHLPEGQGFSIYTAVLPLLAAKQRPTHANDWMSTDALVACPDPNCKSQLKITRVGRREFKGKLQSVTVFVNWMSEAENAARKVYDPCINLYNRALARFQIDAAEGFEKLWRFLCFFKLGNVEPYHLNSCEGIDVGKLNGADYCGVIRVCV